MAAGAAAQSTEYKAKSLIVNLRAENYQNSTGNWDNLATAGAFNTNGDFTTTTGTINGAIARPYSVVDERGISAVLLNGAGRIQTTSTFATVRSIND